MLVASLFACRGPSSHEAEVRRLMERISKIAEKRDAPGLVALLAEDYADLEGRDRAATEELVSGHFRRRFGIVIHLLHSDISVQDADGTAGVEADVALSSGGAELLRRAVRFAGELYRFKLSLRKTPEGWRVTRAKWEPTGPDGLFPESLPALRDLYPGERQEPTEN
jgi:hypothetical protein